MNHVEAVEVLSKAIKMGTSIQKSATQFHDIIINASKGGVRTNKKAELAKSARGGGYKKGKKKKKTMKYAAQKKDKDPKPVDHKSPLLSGKQEMAEPSPAVTEESGTKKASMSGEVNSGSESSSRGGDPVSRSGTYTTSLKGSVAKETLGLNKMMPEKPAEKSAAYRIGYMAGSRL